MSSELLAAPRPSQGVDPFHIGTRYLKCIDANGKPDVTLVPLSEEDFLHPQEEDRFMLTNAHSVAVWYLRQSILQACRTRPSIRVFSDHRIDWQHPDIAPHGPDVVVFDRFTVEWDELRGTLPVVDTGIEVVAVFEVTSESTRHIDFDKKFVEYAAVGIPYYIVVDVAEPNGNPNVRGYRLDGDRYKPMRRDAELGFMVPGLKMWFRWANDTLVAANEDGQDIPDTLGLVESLDEEKVKSEAFRQQSEAFQQLMVTERNRADAERTRADAEQTSAVTERNRANDAERRAEELAAELHRLRGDTAK